MTSANLERALTGYSPSRAGSAILANASISWSWGVAHPTKDCSDLGLELFRIKEMCQNTKNGTTWFLKPLQT